MAASVVSICNSALIKIGSDLIVSLTDQNKRAILCNEQYPKMRDAVLRAHPWNFAVKRVTLAPLVTPPAFGYLNAYQLPADFLKVWKLDSNDIEFRIEGQTLLSDETAINLLYIAQIVDTTKFDSTFSEALACRLAADLAFPIAQSLPLGQAMYAAYKECLKEARLMNAQEGTADQIDASDWTNSRF